MNTAWVSVKDRLPDKFSVYVVTLNYNTVDFCEYYPNKKQFGWKDKICDEVVAWMPLPEPYKEGYNKMGRSENNPINLCDRCITCEDKFKSIHNCERVCSKPLELLQEIERSRNTHDGR